MIAYNDNGTTIKQFCFANTVNIKLGDEEGFRKHVKEHAFLKEIC